MTQNLNEAVSVSLNVLHVEQCTNCDSTTGHICELCFVRETLSKLQAENQRLREALERISEAHDMESAVAGQELMESIAREALEGGEA